MAETLGTQLVNTQCRTRHSLLSRRRSHVRLTIAASLNKAKQLGDVGSVIRYQTLIGDGLVQWKQYDKALKYFDEALVIARSQPDIQHPLLVYSGKIEDSVHRNRKEGRSLETPGGVARRGAGQRGSRIQERAMAFSKQEQARTRAPWSRKAADLADSIDSPRIAAQSTLALAQLWGATDSSLPPTPPSPEASTTAERLVTIVSQRRSRGSPRINVALRRYAVADQFERRPPTSQTA